VSISRAHLPPGYWQAAAWRWLLGQVGWPRQHLLQTGCRDCRPLCPPAPSAPAVQRPSRPQTALLPSGRPPCPLLQCQHIHIWTWVPVSDGLNDVARPTSCQCISSAANLTGRGWSTKHAQRLVPHWSLILLASRPSPCPACCVHRRCVLMQRADGVQTGHRDDEQ
jgi:hypothetical protein